MEPQFWTSRWREGRTGFHQDAVHPDVLNTAAGLLPDAPGRVLIPLAGKSTDIAWFLEQGHQVTAIELSPLAIDAWHQTHNREAVPTPHGDWTCHRSENLDFWCADILKLDASGLGPFDLIWDRAALVALDMERRRAYAKRLSAWLAPSGTLLLNGFEYDQSKMAGPPHAVWREDLADLFPTLHPTLLREGAWQTEGKFADRGVERFRDYLLTLTPSPDFQP